jgi:hypothetical protein
MTNIWEETMKKAILKPKPPSIKVKPKPKVQPKIGSPPDNSPDDDFGEALDERCKCNWPLCRRRAKWACHYCSAKLCQYHKSQVTDRKVGVHGRPADEIHNFAKGTCDGAEWVWD